MSYVELIYDYDCPNLERARSHLRQAFAAAGVPPSWKEWIRGSPDNPSYVGAFGSPTILVDGNDVSPAPVGSASGCRIYMGEDGRLLGVPAVSVIVSALRSPTP